MKQTLQTLLAQMNSGLVDRDHALKAALLCVLAGEHLVLIGPPGTAKSLVARRVADHIQTKGEDGKVDYFEYLLTKFSTPEELFGPLSISELKQDRFRRNTAGYLPTVQVAFLDEIFKASSSILNALLTIINERTFHNGNQPQKVPLRSLISASNELPSGQEELSALYDRFLMRTFVGPVNADKLHLLFDAPGAAHQATVRLTQETLEAVDAAHLTIRIPDEVGEAIRSIWAAHKEAFKEDRRESLSDRRLVKLLKLLRVSAATNNRQEVDLSDVLLLQHCLWNHQDNIAKVREIVSITLQRYSRAVPRQSEGAEVLKDNGKTQKPTQSGNTPAKSVIKGFTGSGTASDPIRINNAEDLMSMDNPAIAAKGYHFLQTADIDCASLTHWAPFAFRGHYDGVGHSISNVKNGQLFSAIEDSSRILNLGLVLCMVANQAMNTTFSNCHSKNSTLIGTTHGCTVTRCSVTNGQLVGNAMNTKISQCESTGMSLIGSAGENTTISDCKVLLDWDSTNTHNHWGGIASSLAKGGVIERCYASGNLKQANGFRFCGLIAFNFGTIRQCAVGALSLDINHANGHRRIAFSDEPSLVQIALGSKLGTFANNASIDTNPGVDDANGPGGKTIAAARFNQRYFENTLGWDFDTVWEWDAGNNRPALRQGGSTSNTQNATKPSTGPSTDLLLQQMQANMWL